jgi:hypothetical protein
MCVNRVRARFVWLLAATTLATIACPVNRAEAQVAVCDEEGCSTYGTAVQWVADPERAAAQALRESKLLFVFHLSGNLAKKEFT